MKITLSLFKLELGHGFSLKLKEIQQGLTKYLLAIACLNKNNESFITA